MHGFSKKYLWKIPEHFMGDIKHGFGRKKLREVSSSALAGRNCGRYQTCLQREFAVLDGFRGTNLCQILTMKREMICDRFQAHNRQKKFKPSSA